MRYCPSLTIRRSFATCADSIASRVRTRSSGSSSAMRIVMVRWPLVDGTAYFLPFLGVVPAVGLRTGAVGLGPLELADRQRNGEGSALTGRALGHDSAAVPLGDLATERQSDAGPRICRAAVKAFEDAEDPHRVARVKPDPVVSDLDAGLAGLDLAAHGDDR